MDEEATQQGAESEDNDAHLISALNGDDDNSFDDHDEDYGDGQEEETPPAPQKHVVKINGTEKEVTIDDLVANYQKGEAANQKFEEAAALRRQAEQQTTQHLQGLQAAINHFNEQAARWAQEEQPDWADLLENNPHEYLRQKEIFEARNFEYQKAQAAQNYINQQQQQAYQQSLAQHIEAESQKLVELIPEWTDKEFRAKEEAELIDFLGKKGYSREEMQNLSNSKASNIKIVLNAMRYEKLVEKAAAAKSKKTPQADAKPVPTVGGTSAARKSPEKMTDAEFAAWRRAQIAKRK